MVTCSETNYNAGGRRSHLGIFHSGFDALECIENHHSSNCDANLFCFCDGENFIECPDCKFYISDMNIIDDNQSYSYREYCDACKKEEKNIFTKNNYPITNFCCKECTYNKDSDGYSRIFCSSCKKWCFCEICSFDFSFFTKIIEENKQVRKQYSYIKSHYPSDDVYVAIDIFNKNEDYETSWNS